MIAYAAVDVSGGRAVQLVGGDPAEGRVSLPDPVGVARRWVESGFRALHVIDIDAALGRGSNRELIEEIAAIEDATIQVGGGVRDDETADAMLAAGADRVVIGTRGIDDPEWLAALTQRHPGRVVIAGDLTFDRVLTHGWTRPGRLNVMELLEEVKDLPLAAVLVTDVAREGSVQGIDTMMFGVLAASTSHPVIAAGGIRSIADLRVLRNRGLAGAVIGMALYTGQIDPRTVVKDFST